jgi:hypothetical protein
MQSIYKTLLAINKPINIIPIGYDCEDDCDDYCECGEEYCDNGDTMQAIPLKRDMLVFGAGKDADSENIENLESAMIHYPVKKLDEYDDGELYKEYPIAVSFTMDIHSYYNVVNSDAAHDGTLRITHFGPYFNTLFDKGVIVMAFKCGDKMDVIAGFKQEGGVDD